LKIEDSKLKVSQALLVVNRKQLQS